ncbi:hypothetical protein V8E54_006108 [Elaphomyces granulatus]
MDSDDGGKATPDASDSGTDEKMNIEDNITGQAKRVEKSNHPAPTRTNKRGGTKTTDDGDGNIGRTPKKLKPKNTRDKKTTIPTSYETASMEDRMLLHMKEVEMKSWSEIRTQWEAMTGTKVGNSTLSTRYIRIKAKLAGFKPEDGEKLIQAKKKVEEKFEATKWNQIAATLEAMGGSKYPVAMLRKQYKELCGSKKLVAGGSNANHEASDSEDAIEEKN